MTTNTAGIRAPARPNPPARDGRPPAAPALPGRRPRVATAPLLACHDSCSVRCPQRSRLPIVAALLLACGTWLGAQASTVLGPWTPLFKGIDHAVGTNTPGGGSFPNLQVIHAIRVDLTDPDVRLFATPRISNYVANVREVAGYTVKDFLATNRLQVAINANAFEPSQYYLAAGTPMDVNGLLLSQGTVVSSQLSYENAAVIAFTSNNVPAIIPTNTPANPTAGWYTAVAGEYCVLIAGVNVGYKYTNSSQEIHQVQPRTAFGISRDRHLLYVLTIDGRQPGYSEGALDWETGAWLLRLGAYDAVNLDGGGSTSLVRQDSLGNPVVLNNSSAAAGDPQGRERTVGAHFGVFAKPAPAFINDVAVAPDDTAATITWTTAAPATGQVAYGLSTDLGATTDLQAQSSTNHAALITGLEPNTTYYFMVQAAETTNTHQSPLFAFTTTNYVTTNALFDVTYSWKYTSQNLDGLPWTDSAYDDSAWGGPGPGLLWVNRNGPNPAVQPQGTVLPGNPADGGFPFITYYFRTHFTYAHDTTGAALLFSCYLDDGAVFYLNGREIRRLEMPDAPAPVYHDTLASSYYCATGNATCPLDFTVAGASATNLVAGDNVLAVEVHNYNARSPDITFGTSLAVTEPAPPATAVKIRATDGAVTLTWDRNSLVLQQAPAPAGPWADVPGPVFISPHIVVPGLAPQYYRLRR